MEKVLRFVLWVSLDAENSVLLYIFTEFGLAEWVSGGRSEVVL